MPATTQIASWTLSNLGPVTTTFTPAPSCSGPYNVEIGRYEEVPIDDTTSVSSSLAWIGSPCENTGARFANCIPSGSVVDSQFSAFWTRPSPVPTRRFAIDYYSPGFICPSGYSTVGVATKSTGGSVSSSGPAFVPRSADPWVIENVLEDVTPNVLLQSLDEGESAVLCCPSNYSVDVDGLCSSLVPDYPIPSSICVDIIPTEDVDLSLSTTETIFGTTYTGVGAAVFTGTIPEISTTITLPTGSASMVPSWVAGDVVNVLYLVYAATDTAAASNTGTASSGATGKSNMATAAKTNLSAVMILFTVVVAFASGFIILVPI